MLVKFLAVDLPKKVDVKGWGLFVGCRAGCKWIVKNVLEEFWKITGFVGRGENREHTGSCWSVRVGTLEESIRCPEGVAGACIV